MSQNVMQFGTYLCNAISCENLFLFKNYFIFLQLDCLLGESI